MQDLDFSEVKRVAEIGSGPGFIGKYIATKSPALQALWLNDINPSAKQYFKDTNEDSRTHFALQDGKEFLQQQEAFDVVVCNPPYLPKPKSIDDNAYEGLSLAEYPISNCKSFLTSHGRLFIVLPTFAEFPLFHALSHPEIAVKILREKEVLLKVSTVLNNPEWMDYLLSKGLKKEIKQGHEYWQTIKVLQITPQRSV
ncbi:MAG: methyltransferase [Candidatus Peribacteria bacterium]|nr:methyltransferase [Candidatus Peribacteria bacterium]